MGRWQREYELDWRDFTQRVIQSRFGKYAAQCSPSIRPADELQLQAVLASAGITHVPPNHNRWHAPIPASQSFSMTPGPQDSLLSDGSYVYSTPPSPDSQTMFPAFSLQDVESHATSGRRISASQRLRLRMADVSPIATHNRRTSIECARTISPSLGVAKSPWTLEQWSPTPVGKSRRTPRRSLEASFRGEDLDVSMQSMHLSDDEDTRMDEDVKEGIERAETNADEQEAVACLMVKRREAESVNEFQELMYSNNDADNEEDKGKRVHGSPPPRSLTKDPTLDIEPDFEFGARNECDSECQQLLNGEQDVAVRESCFSKTLRPIDRSTHEDIRDSQCISIESTPTSAKSNSVTRQECAIVTARSSLSAISAKKTSCASPIAPSPRNASCTTHTASSTTKRAFAQPTTLSAKRTALASSLASSVQKASHAFIVPSSVAQTAPASSKSALSQKRANQGLLLHTKLPLQMEYRFASDRRRRHRRRKSLAAKPGVFPYVVPELLVELQPYQEKALQWMLEREQEPGDPITIDQLRCGEVSAVDALVAKVCGGILADEMGLGKTICCLALICESLRQARAADAQARSKTGSTVPRLTPPTLIITPLSILSQWEQEIRAKTNLSVVTYQGATRKNFRSATQFMGADIVLSTYDTLRLLECKIQEKDSDHDNDEEHGDRTGAKDGWRQAPRLTPRSKKPVVRSKLHQLQWFRVILDESHLIANAGCGRARASRALRSRRRWCVTGTPIQNRTADLVALLQFIGLENRAQALSERELEALVPRVVMRRLKSMVDARSRAPILELPKKSEETIALDFSSDVERTLYMLLHRFTKREVLQYLQTKEAKQTRQSPLTTSAKDSHKSPHFMHVFELILRLRQVCNSCALVTTDTLAEVRTQVESGRSDGISPFTSGETELLKRLESDTNDISKTIPLGSTKLIELMKELKKVRARRERVLVISQWTSFLDMIGERLEAHNSQCEARVSSVDNDAIIFAKLDGRMSVKDREQVVRTFQQQEDVSDTGRIGGPSLDVLLLSLRTGGLGLNLTAAAHVFIMEPSWNPSLELQAIDRAHRFGQTREVRVVRFIIKGSIEERVLALQNEKRQLTAAFLGDGDMLNSVKTNKLCETKVTREDLRRLFLTQQDEVEALRHQGDENGIERDPHALTCIDLSD